MSSLLQALPSVEPVAIRIVRDPDLPPIREDERDQLSEPSPLDRRPLSPWTDWSACLRVQEWLLCQMRYQESLGHDGPDEEFHDLISSTINDVRCAFGVRYHSVSELLQCGPDPYRGLDLSVVRIPARHQSHLAELVDEWVQHYLDLGTEIAALVAWALLQVAEAIEHHGAETIQEYFGAEDALARECQDYDAGCPS